MFYNLICVKESYARLEDSINLLRMLLEHSACHRDVQQRQNATLHLSICSQMHLVSKHSVAGGGQIMHPFCV